MAGSSLETVQYTDEANRAIQKFFPSHFDLERNEIVKLLARGKIENSSPKDHPVYKRVMKMFDDLGRWTKDHNGSLGVVDFREPAPPLPQRKHLGAVLVLSGHPQVPQEISAGLTKYKLEALTKKDGERDYSRNWPSAIIFPCDSTALCFNAWNVRFKDEGWSWNETLKLWSPPKAVKMNAVHIQGYTFGPQPTDVEKRPKDSKPKPQEIPSRKRKLEELLRDATENLDRLQNPHDNDLDEEVDEAVNTTPSGLRASIKSVKRSVRKCQTRTKCEEGIAGELELIHGNLAKIREEIRVISKTQRDIVKTEKSHERRLSKLEAQLRALNALEFTSTEDSSSESEMEDSSSDEGEQ